jgi:hypothetical protein
MIEKDKAIELVSKYMMVDTHDEDHFIIRQQRGKKCALIAIDEILEIVKSDDSALIVELPYWQEVKQEIEKL